ncbi:MAG: serine acetyltransferase [Deltaproteobacteria bacterium]|jgi:serine O-acetyltransferase|nr:serine acetyltransferase [Deltaproteobacteria bacterium]
MTKSNEVNEVSIKTLVKSILDNYEEHKNLIKVEACNQLNKEIIIDIIYKLRALIFPGYFSQKPLKQDSLSYHVGDLVEDVQYQLQKQITRALRHESVDRPSLAGPQSVTRAFLERLPAIRNLLATDVEAAYEGDPAAFNYDEIILSYPGIFAIMVNRLAHELYLLGVPLIPRMMTEYAHGETGIDIHPGASIGHHLFIDHGTGIVVGETTVIGNFVKIYQGVTLGALSTRGGHLLDGVKRHPTIETHVTIYSGASILGGSTVVGEGVVIGSNAFITKSIPEKTKVSVKNTELQFMSEVRKDSAPEKLQDEFWDWVI